MMSAEKTPCACTTLRKTSRAVTRFYDEALRESGLTATQLAVLRAVARAGPVPMSRVAESLVMDRTTFYRAIAPLLRSGSLRARPAEGDGRAKRLELSPEGRRRMDEAGRSWGAAQRLLVQRIGASRWRELSAWLVEMTEDALSLAPPAGKGGRT